MSVNGPSGSTAFDRLRAHLDATRLRCSSCGHEDARGGWRATTSGGQVRYRHVCPSCGATDAHDLRLARR